jgi:hypothetical protein
MVIYPGELAALLGVAVGPVLLVASIVQSILLHRAGVRIGPMLGVLLAGVVATLLLTWGLLYVTPPVLDFAGGYVGVLFLPALIASAAVTVCVWLGPGRRRPRG